MSNLIGTASDQVPVNGMLGDLAFQDNDSVNIKSLTVTSQLDLTNASNYNLYASGAGANYMAGSLGIGGVPSADAKVEVAGTYPSSGAVSRVIRANGIIPSTTTATARLFGTESNTQAAVFNISNLQHFCALQSTMGAGSTVTNQYGFLTDTAFTGATNNYAFYGAIPAGTGRYNLYMSGTADNYLGGRLGIGTTSLSGNILSLGTSLTGTTAANAVIYNGQINSDASIYATIYNSTPSIQASAALTNVYHFDANQGTKGAGASITRQFGFTAESTLTGATNNYGFYGGIASGTGRYNLYMSGTATNYLAGDLQLAKTVTAVGTTGAQTINKTTGTVNFAAGAASLVVTNSLVTANSIIIATVGSNDTSMKSVAVIADAGSFTLHANAAATAETRVNFLITN